MALSSFQPTEQSFYKVHPYDPTPTTSPPPTAPTTVIYAPDGTRRQATLAGIDPHSDAYVRWIRERMVESMDVLCQMQVQHVFQGVVRASHFAEQGTYRERLIDWITWFLTGPEALGDWCQRGWRIRLIGGEAIPQLQEVAARLHDHTPAYAPFTVWFYLSTTPQEQWATMLNAARQLAEPTQAALIKHIYGEPIPLATVYISSNKTLIASDALPPAIPGEMHCYWMLRPGYALDEATMQQIIRDIHNRQTWTANKTDRYQYVHAHRDILECPNVLGLGQRIGPFWYPLTQDTTGGRADYAFAVGDS